MSGLNDDELEEIDSRAAAASPGPWFVRHLDDDDAMSLVAIGRTPDTGQGNGGPSSITATSSPPRSSSNRGTSM